MTLLGLRLAVAIPDTVSEEKDSLRDRTVKLGLIARACAIYGVDLIEIFRDPKGHGRSGEMRKVLEYLDAPQYLRRRLFPLDEALKYAGLLPPLRIPSHKPKVPVDRVSVGEVREGVVNADGTVDVGLDASPKLVAGAQSGTRVTVRVSSLGPFTAEAVTRDQVKGYWGYDVEEKRIADVLADQRFKVRIATSRLGVPLPSALASLRPLVRGAGSVKLVFGSPSRGLFEMIGDELSRRVDVVLNLFPDQQVETVRTEEALFAGLGLVNLLSTEKA